MEKVGRSTVKFDNVYILDTGTVVGPLENQGPIGSYFDYYYSDMYCNEKSWEKAEQRLLDDAIRISLEKTNFKENDIDFLVSGDLLNQNITSNYVARKYDIPFFGIYDACSTSMQGLLLASILVDSKLANNVIAATASHNATAERQYRYPTEYGGQKPDTATFTVTGAGSAVVSNKKGKIKVTSATVGKVIDAGQKNPLDMGTAMAPAASETIKQHLEDLNIEASYYDLIVTGDLSYVGSPVLVDILKAQNINIETVHNDCGLIIYNRDEQQVFAGGSGCACCAVVTYSYLINKLINKEYKRILVVATGALLNPIIMQQKESIPSIANAVCLESGD